jgi:formylglycine-generating enzyme required for sulfatase activity
MTNSLSTFHPDALERGELVDAVTGNMVWIPGGTFRMGSDRHYVEEAPAHRVTVDAFWIDRFPVTNDDFRRFVDDTGHVTYAELEPNAADYPGALPEMLYAGSLVFDTGGSREFPSVVVVRPGRAIYGLVPASSYEGPGEGLLYPAQSARRERRREPRSPGCRTYAT